MRRNALLIGLTVTSGLVGLSGCGDPCLDDGFMQDDAAEGCPSAADSLDGSTSEAGTDTATESETDANACFNGVSDPGETGIDCGGTCAATCGSGEGCGSNEDCASGVCAADGTCEGPACDNGAQDGDETDVDCGGSCPAGCDAGQGCSSGEDCESGSCSDEGTCEEPTNPGCGNKMQDGDETDVDCGGPDCGPCTEGQMCVEDRDCLDGNCEGDVCEVPTGDTCNDAQLNGDETDIDCGGEQCQACDDGEACAAPSDCVSGVCTDDECQPPACDDGVQNGDETDTDCGGACGATCGEGDDCTGNGDCTDGVCLDDNTCAAALSVDVDPVCEEYTTTPLQVTATASGGTGTYTYAWTPAATLDDATIPNPMATPSGFATYEVTVDDGVGQTVGRATFVDSNAFDLEDNCTLFTADFDNAGDASISYNMGGTQACEQGNNDFGLHLCEGVSFQDIRLTGQLSIASPAGMADDDMVGLVWGAQDNAHFYSMSWKQGAQMIDGCAVPAGIVVKRVEADDFGSLEFGDIYCPENTEGSTLLLGPAGTTTDGWEFDRDYDVAIEFRSTGSHITVSYEDGGTQTVAEFDVMDTMFTGGAFGSTTFSQEGACVGGLVAECL